MDSAAIIRRKKSTEMIIDITEQFGGDQKPELTKTLVIFRNQIRREITGSMERNIEKIKKIYHD